MLRFERTHDYALVRQVMTHQAVYPGISDDGCPPAEGFKPSQHPAIWYVLALDDDELLGLWMFIPENTACWKVHTCLLPWSGFRRGREAARAIARWIVERTTCRRIVTEIPSFNRAAQMFARAAGMRQYGVNPNSYLKNDKLHDQVLMGLSPEESPTCPQL